MYGILSCIGVRFGNNNDVCFPVIGTVTKLQIVPGAGYDLGTVKFNGNILEPDSEGFITLDASTISGTPTLRIEGEYAGPTKWGLFKKDAGTYNFGAIVGTMLLLK